MSDLSREQLDWLAEQYVLDALPPDERARFETQLAEDQAARDALADAVELTAAIVAAEPASLRIKGDRAERPSGRRRQSIRARSVAWAAAVALGLVALLSWQWMRGGTPGVLEDRSGEIATTSSGEADLAGAWLQVRSELASEDYLAPLATETETPEAVPLDESPEFDVEASPLKPPSWMLAAVTEMQPTDSLDMTEGP